MKKILSIDFDCIMSPCINLYNDHVGGNLNSTQLWEFLQDKYQIDKFLSYDAKILENIILAIIKAVKAGATFIPIDTHEDIVEVLKLEGININTESFDIVNVDYHHDILYNMNQYSSMTDFDVYNCSNWLGYLLSKNKNSHATWMRCPNSNNCQEQILEHFDGQFEVSSIKNINELDFKDYSYVFLCLSPQWVPYKYHHLYTLIVSIINNIGG